MRASFALLVLPFRLVLAVLCSVTGGVCVFVFSGVSCPVCFIGLGALCSLVSCVLAPLCSSVFCPLVSPVLVPLCFGLLRLLVSPVLVLLRFGVMCPLLSSVVVPLRFGVLVVSGLVLLCSIVLASFVLVFLCSGVLVSPVLFLFGVLVSPELVLLCFVVLCLFLLFRASCFPCRGCSTVVSWCVLSCSFVVCGLSRFVCLWFFEGPLVVFVVVAWSVVVWTSVM